MLVDIPRFFQMKLTDGLKLEYSSISMLLWKVLRKCSYFLHFKYIFLFQWSRPFVILRFVRLRGNFTIPLDSEIAVIDVSQYVVMEEFLGLCCVSPTSMNVPRQLSEKNRGVILLLCILLNKT